MYDCTKDSQKHKSKKTELGLYIPPSPIKVTEVMLQVPLAKNLAEMFSKRIFRETFQRRNLAKLLVNKN